MRIGVFSDVHDNLHALRATLEQLKAEGIDTALFCGDFCSPIPARIMGESKMKIHAVFGNTDDRPKITMFADKEFPDLKVYQDSDRSEVVLAEKKIAFYHFPWLADALARTGDYQAVFYGHTHQPKEEMHGNTLFLNPGELMGWKGDPTYAVYDLNTNAADIRTLSQK